MGEGIARRGLGSIGLDETTGIVARLAGKHKLLIVRILVEDAHPVIRRPAEIQVFIDINLRFLSGLLEGCQEAHLILPRGLVVLLRDST